MSTDEKQRHGWPAALKRELRTDHAGEAGAVMIYRGVLAVARDDTLRAFAQHHLETESRHLALIEEVVPPSGRSRLLPLWRVAGWLTGALPACFGPRRSSRRSTRWRLAPSRRCRPRWRSCARCWRRAGRMSSCTATMRARVAQRPRARGSRQH
jgi:hypothetical protein